jgi:hypothetical protein
VKSNSPKSTCQPHPALALERDRDARARAWAYVFDCHHEKEAATSPVSRPDDEKGRSSNDPLATTNSTR